MRNVVPTALVVLGLLTLIAGCDPVDESQHDRNQSTDAIAAVLDSVDPNSVDVSVDEPNGSRPVAVGAAFDRPQARPGEVVTLVVRSKIAEPWHIYAAEGPTGVGRPTQIELKLPAGISEDSWRVLPEATTEESTLGPVAIYHGDVRFAVPLKLANDVNAGSVQVQCQFKYQACTDSQCLRPSSESLVIPLDIVSE